MVRAVIFDMDGLLVDTEIISFKIYEELLKEFGFSFSLNDYVCNYSGKTEVANVSRFIETYKLPWSVDEGVKKVLEIERQLLSKGVDLKKGAAQLLAYLSENHIQIALATSSLKDRALQILEGHNILHFFDAFVFGPELERGKPHPDIFQIACEKLGQKTEDCLVLEDSENGIQAAYSAHVPVICIPDMKMPAQKYLDMVIATLPSLEEVRAYL